MEMNRPPHTRLFKSGFHHCRLSSTCKIRFPLSRFKRVGRGDLSVFSKNAFWPSIEGCFYVSHPTDCALKISVWTNENQDWVINQTDPHLTHFDWAQNTLNYLPPGRKKETFKVKNPSSFNRLILPIFPAIKWEGNFA